MIPLNPDDRAGARHDAIFAAAAAALVTSEDTLGIITGLLVDASDALGAAGAGLVLVGRDGGLELLAAISHRAEELQLFQLQVQTGPCVDAVRQGTAVAAATADAIVTRWPALAAAFRSAGFGALHATPMRWHGQTLGAVNLFWHTSHDVAQDRVLIQAYTDIATVVIVHAEPVTVAELAQRTQDALASRRVIEQAKGVLAYRHRVSMQAAYAQILRIAGACGNSLSDTAAHIIDEAHQSPRN